MGTDLLLRIIQFTNSAQLSAALAAQPLIRKVNWCVFAHNTKQFAHAPHAIQRFNFGTSPEILNDNKDGFTANFEWRVLSSLKGLMCIVAVQFQLKVRFQARDSPCGVGDTS